MSRRLPALFVVSSPILMILLAFPPARSLACSCVWLGPFLEVARADVPLVVRGRILRHHAHPAAMDVLVLETLAGGLLDSGLRVAMGDGWQCRPALDAFPPGGDWVLALNGPGAKPGAGWALSHCGAHALRIEKTPMGDEYVVGEIDGAQGEIQRWPWPEFLRRFRSPPPTVARFTGRIQAGERRCHGFGGRFAVCLDPQPQGWLLRVHESGRDADLARLTPPLHFAPNPREIEGWHLSATPTACASRPHGADAGPANPRSFVFSPEVGGEVAAAGQAVTPEDVARVAAFGRGTLWIDAQALTPAPDGCPDIAWLDYRLRVTWDRAAEGTVAPAGQAR